MSDAKTTEPAAGAAPGAEAKPAEPKPSDAKAPAEVKAAVAAKPHEAKPPAPKVAEAKPPEAKAPEAKPAEAKPADPKAAALPSRAPAPKAHESNVNITISARTAALLATGLALVVLFFGGLALFLMVRLNDLGHKDAIAALKRQVPGQDGVAEVAKGPAKAGGHETVGAAAAAETEVVTIGEHFKDDFGGKASTLPGSWPSFRGPKRDNVGTGDVKLAERWPASGPPILWGPVDLGVGYAGAAVLNGRVYLLDYDQKAKEDALRCFSLEDGKEIWRCSYRVKITNNHEITRTVPAVTDKYVVSMGPKCHVMCVEAQSGKFKWGIDLMKDYGTKMPDWYTAQCPIIDGTTVVVAPAGTDVLMMGVDCETGKIVWKTPNPKGWKMSHASIVPMALGGKKTYIYSAQGGLAAVSGADDAGAERPPLWELTYPNDWTVIAPSPVVLDDGYIFQTAGYGKGSMLIQVADEGGKYQAKTLWKKEPKEGASCEQQTPIYFAKHLFAVCPDSSGALKGQLLCMNPYDNGKTVWQSGGQKRFGQYESYMLADGKLYLLGADKDDRESLNLTMVRATPAKYEELARLKLPQWHDAWAPMALAGERMILRDKGKMICINVGKGIE